MRLGFLSREANNRKQLRDGEKSREEEAKIIELWVTFALPVSGYGRVN